MTKNDFKTCTGCKKDLDGKEFSRVSPSTNGYEKGATRSRCRRCLSILASRNEMSRALDRNPEKYRFCESADCAKVYAKSLYRCPECKIANEQKATA